MYKPGRKFQGIMMPKGKGSDKRAPKPYLREQREPVLVAGKVVMQPVSRQKMEKFLKEQCEELKDYIAETDESRFLGHVHVKEVVEEERVEEEKVEEERVEEEKVEEDTEETEMETDKEEDYEVEEIPFDDVDEMEIADADIEDVSDDESL